MRGLAAAAVTPTHIPAITQPYIPPCVDRADPRPPPAVHTRARSSQRPTPEPEPEPARQTQTSTDSPSVSTFKTMESVTESLGRASVGTPSTTSKFTLHSSIACPFLVISEVQLVQSKAAPTAAEFAELTATAMAMVGAWEAGRASILADFEGENLGWGGELLCAQFLPTASLDASLRPANQPAAAKTPTCGLLIDARSSAAMAIVRRIMQGEQLTKLIWGADGDLASLRHNILPAIGAVVRNRFSQRRRLLRLPCRVPPICF